MKSRLPPFKETPDLRGCHHKKGPYTTGTILCLPSHIQAPLITEHTIIININIDHSLHGKTLSLCNEFI